MFRGSQVGLPSSGEAVVQRGCTMFRVIRITPKVVEAYEASGGGCLAGTG